MANRLLDPIGLHLVRRDQAFEMEGMVARAAARGVAVNTWIDVGASDGSWSLKARRHFPSAKFLLFEPLAERQDTLARLNERHGFIAVPAAAGGTHGSITFAVDPDLDGSGIATESAITNRVVPVATIDSSIQTNALQGPYGLKLDTHGYELPVLSGAAAVLAQTNLLIIEAYNFKLTPDSLRFAELCTYLENSGFRCCDLADPMRRPKDGALWQMDLAFAPCSSPLFASSDYR